MMESKEQSILRAEKRPAENGKRAYRKPEFRFESVFETRALSCGKRHANEESCKYNRKSS
jgi:hypothetical protein